MKTDSLIRALAADSVVHRPSPYLTAAGLLAALGATVLLLWAALGFREDLAAAVVNPLSALRFVLAGALALVAGRLALILARPEGANLARLWPLAVIGAVAFGALLWAFVTAPVGGVQMAVFGKTAVSCLISIPLLSLLPVAVILFALKGGAVTAPALAGAVAGLCGGGLAAMVYALHCTEDSPLFYVTWYGLAIAGITLTSSLVGARLLRW